MVADGGIPVRYDADGNVVETSAPKEIREFGGRQYVLETALTADFGLVRAAVGDRHGNLVFHESAANFNPLAGMAGRVTIAEVETLVRPDEPLLAIKIEVQEVELEEVEFEGIIEDMPPDFPWFGIWLIDGREVEVNADTVIEGTPEVDLIAEVEALVRPGEPLLAIEVEIKEAGGGS